MGKPVVDARHVAQGELHFNTRPIMGKIPNPVIKLLVIQIYKIVAESGYANVTITIKESPRIEETTDAQGQVALKLRNDGSGLRGPVIEITTLDGHLTGEYTLAMTKDGVMAKIPPPTQLLKRFTGGRKKISAPAAAAIGSVPAAQEFDAQHQGPLGTTGTDSARFYDSSAPGPQQLRPVPGQRVPTSSAPGLQPSQPIAGQRGPASSASGTQQLRPMPGQRMPTSSAPGPPPLKPISGQKGPTSLAPGPQQLRPIPGPTGPSPSAPGPQQLRPHPVQRVPNSTAPGRAPVPATAFSQRGNNQSGPRPGQYQGQQQGFGKSSGREKGGCCSGIGGSGSSRTPGESGRVNASMSKDGKNKSEKERRRREKKDRKQAEKRMKKQKRKGKKGGYGDSGGMYAEKSGFYDDRKKRSWGCC